MLSRIFFLTDNFCNFYTVQCALYFCENFVKTASKLAVFLPLNKLISRNFCEKIVLEQSRAKYDCQFTVWKNEKFTLTQNFFRQINYLVILLVKSLFSRNFCQKRVRVNFRNFHTVWQFKVWKIQNFSATQILREINL